MQSLLIPNTTGSRLTTEKPPWACLSGSSYFRFIEMEDPPRLRAVPATDCGLSKSENVSGTPEAAIPLPPDCGCDSLSYFTPLLWWLPCCDGLCPQIGSQNELFLELLLLGHCRWGSRA